MSAAELRKLPPIQGREAPPTLGRALASAAEGSSAKVHFFRAPNDVESVSYAALYEGALRVAGALRDLGMREGERVAIVLPTHADFYHAFFGVSLAGGVPVALYPPVRLGRMDEWKDRTAAMLRAASAVCVLTERRLVGLLGGPVRVAAPRLGCRTVAGLLECAEPAQPVERAPGDLAAVQFSSGSTGDPKPVGLSHHNMIANAWEIMRTFPGRLEDHSGVSWLPLYHDMGLVGGLLVAVVGHGDLTLIGPERFVARPRIWLEALTWSCATISVAPNFAFGLCTSRISPADREGLDLSAWQLALCGAEPVHPSTMASFASHFADVGFKPTTLMPVYGLAEATLAVTFTDVDAEPLLTSFDARVLEEEGRAEVSEGPGSRRLVALGRPLGGVEVEIRDADGAALAEGRVGTVWTRGDGVMVGYLDRPDLTARAIVEGWLDTGDTGFVHEGQLYLCGRVKDIVIIRGRNHDPALVEQALDGVEGVRTGCAAAFGVGDEETGTERLVVLVEGRVDPEQVDALVAAGVAAVRAATSLSPEPLVVLEPGTLPRTSSGKIRRAEARRMWLAGELRPPGPGGVATLLKESALGLASHLRAIGERQLFGRKDRE